MNRTTALAIGGSAAAVAVGLGLFLWFRAPSNSGETADAEKAADASARPQPPQDGGKVAALKNALPAPAVTPVQPSKPTTTAAMEPKPPFEAPHHCGPSADAFPAHIPAPPSFAPALSQSKAAASSSGVPTAATTAAETPAVSALPDDAAALPPDALSPPHEMVPFSSAPSLFPPPPAISPSPAAPPSSGARAGPLPATSSLPSNLFLPPFYGGGADANPVSVHERDVFLSHAQLSGGDLALALSTALLAADITSWYDMNMTPYGLNNEAMREGVRRCSLFCFLLTPGALTRAAVRMELAEAVMQNKRALVLVLDGTTAADIAAEVDAGVAAAGTAPAEDKWLDESALRAYFHVHVVVRVGVGDDMDRAVASVAAAVRGAPWSTGQQPLHRIAVHDVDAGGDTLPTIRICRRRALSQRLGSHKVATGIPQVFLLGVRGNVYIEYLHRALLLACPAMAGIRIFGDGRAVSTSPVHIVALLEPALFDDDDAVRLLKAQPLDRLQLLFRRTESGTFGLIMAATPPALAARSLYAHIGAVAIERDVEKRWPDLCKLLANLGAERRSDPLPVPPLPPAFDSSFCADTIASLKSSLQASSAIRAGVVGGRGGVGKTSVVSAFAADGDTQDAFDMILWATVGRSAGRGDLRNVLNDILRALNGSLSDDVETLDLDQVVATVREAVERPTRRVLLVLDDLSDAAYGEHFRILSGVIPRGASSASLVLATTRDVDVAARYVPASAHALVCAMQPLSIDSAVQLLARAAPSFSSGDSVSALGALAEEVGRSPYALQLVARILRQTSLDEYESAAAAVESVRERIATATLKPSLTFAHAPPGSAPVYRTVEAALAETFAAKEREVFSTFGLFAEDADIPVGLLCAAWSRGEEDREDLLRRLANAALIKRNGACVQLHDFAWDFACAERTPASMAAKQRAFLDRAKAQLCGGGGGSSYWVAIGRVHNERVRSYMLRSLRHHFCAAGRAEEYTALLFSLNWLAVAIKFRGVQDVIRDVVEHSRFEGLVGSSGAAELRSLFQTLQFSVPGLVEGAFIRERLVAQLIGRLRGIGALVREGTHLGRLLSEAEAMAERSIAEAAASSLHPLADRDVWLLPFAPEASLRGPGAALQTTLHGHTDAVSSTCLLPKGLLSSASFDRTVRIWSVASGECFRTLTGHEGSVNSVASLGPDSDLVASASDDETVRIWSIASGECLKTLTGHRDPVRSVASHGPDSGLIASASFDSTIRIWSVVSGDCLKTLTGHEGGVVCVASLGPDSGLIASASIDNEIRIWSVGSGVCLNTLRGHEDGVSSIAYLGPDSGLIASSSLDGTLRIWNVSSGACVKTLTGHDGGVSSVCLLEPDSGLVASTSFDGTLRIWHALRGECLKVLQMQSVPLHVSFLGPDNSDCVAISYLDPAVRIWNVRAGGSRDVGVSFAHLVEDNSDDDEDGTDIKRRVTSVCMFGSDDSLLASASVDTTIRIWSAVSGVCLKTLSGHTKTVHSVCSMGPDTGLLASASLDKSVRIWRVSDGKCMHTLFGRGRISQICFPLGPDSGLLACASWDRDKEVVDMFRVSSGELVDTFPRASDRGVEVLSNVQQKCVPFCVSSSLLWLRRSARGNRSDGLSFHRVNSSIFLDDDVVSICPIRTRDESEGSFKTVGAFTKAHEYHVCAILPCFPEL